MKKRENFFKRIFKKRSATINSPCGCESLKDKKERLTSYFVGKVMSSPEIQTAINYVAEVFSTIPTSHRRTLRDGTVEYLNSSINYTLNVNPNPLQNKTQFWVSVITQLFKTNNSVIVPEWDEVNGNLTSLVPMMHTSNYREQNGEYKIDIFTDVGTKTYNVKDVIILNRFSNLNGGGSNSALHYLQSLMMALLDYGKEAALNPKLIKAYIQLREGNLPPEAAEKIRQDVLRQLTNNAEGEIPIVTLNADMDLRNIDIDTVPMDKTLLEYATKQALRWFGISNKMLDRDTDEYSWQLAIATTFTPLLNQCAEEFSRKLFSRREIEMGNWIEFDKTALQVATLSSITNFMRTAIPHSVVSPDEVREILGYGNKPDGMGQKFFQTLNVVLTEYALEYQKNMATGGALPQLLNPERNSNEGET